MAQAVVMPKLGQTVEEAAIVKWHRKEGDTVKKGDVLFEIETDKAVLEAESFYDGTLLKILVREGETVPVSSVVCYVGKPGESVPAASERPELREQRPERREEKPSPAAAPAPAHVPRTSPAPSPAAAPAPDIAPAPGRLFISPRAKALARECVVDPANLQGSGPNGRIVVKDVKAYLDASGYGRIRITPSAKKLAAKENIDVLKVRGTGVSGRIMIQDIKRATAEKPREMSRMRQVIAGRLTQSFTTTPHFYVTVSVDMTDLLAFRVELKEQGQDWGVTDFILKAVIFSLLEFPPVNSVAEGTKVRWHGGVDLGLAVALEDGLVVPVINDAEDLSMKDLHEAAQALRAKARDGNLTPDEMRGSTFTVSNMGMMGVENFTAIINPGESAILAVCSTVKSPVVKDDKMVVRSIMKMTLSADHRIIDGATAVQFLNAVKGRLEDTQIWKSLI